MLVDVPPLSSFKRLILLPVSATLRMYVGNWVYLSREWFLIVIVEFVEKMGLES